MSNLKYSALRARQRPSMSMFMLLSWSMLSSKQSLSSCASAMHHSLLPTTGCHGNASRRSGCLVSCCFYELHHILTCFEISPLDIFRLLFTLAVPFFSPFFFFTRLVPEGRRFKKLSCADFPCFYISHSKQRRPAVRSLWRYLKHRHSEMPVCIDKKPANINPC